MTITTSAMDWANEARKSRIVFNSNIFMASPG
jgi:hypothetical protein